ncbi:MAG TPA: 4Fe-4S dicluster domain-containing protein [Thermoplasmata archaeon]|nr:4Fe-4S dicluster domain-containing protein [Thermoplasmata archaeon]
MGILGELFKQIIKKPATNPFPVKYAPSTETLKKVAKGEVTLDQLNPPVPTPDHFRGRVMYYKDRCIGCRMCLRVCPSKAIEFIKEEKKIKIYVGRCTFCEMCVNICPKDALEMSGDFLMADYEPYAETLITTGDPEPKTEKEDSED